MERSGRNKWRSMRFLPWGEGLEGRQLLSGSWPPYISHAELKALLNNPVGNPAVRPNTPVLPYGTVSVRTPRYIHRPLRSQLQQEPRLQLHQPPRTLTRRLASSTAMRSS